MYELTNGTARLVFAIKTAAANPSSLAQLANVLHYLPDQLQEDAKAAVDYFDRFRVQAVNMDPLLDDDE